MTYDKHDTQGKQILNKFGLRFVVRRVVENKVTSASAQILVDGEPIKEKLAVDLRELVDSLTKSSNFYMFTCGCGNAGCAGVEDGVLVTHHDESVIWEYRLPQSTDGFGSETESAYYAWLKESTLHRHVFDRSQMIWVIKEALQEANATHASNAGYPVYGFEREDITKLTQKVERLN